MDAGEEGAWCHQCSEGEPPVKKQRELSLRRRAQKGNQQNEVALGVGVHLCLTGLLLPQVTVPFQTESLYRESMFVRSFCMYPYSQYQRLLWLLFSNEWMFIPAPCNGAPSNS